VDTQIEQKTYFFMSQKTRGKHMGPNAAGGNPRGHLSVKGTIPLIHRGKWREVWCRMLRYTVQMRTRREMEGSFDVVNSLLPNSLDLANLQCYIIHATMVHARSCCKHPPQNLLANVFTFTVCY
jgi:hypothetical protein